MSKQEFTQHINTRKLQRNNTRLSNVIGIVILSILVFALSLIFTACDGVSDHRPVIDLSTIQAATIDGDNVHIIDRNGNDYIIVAE